MEKTLYSYKLKSHPEKTLFDHLYNVQDLVLKELNKKILGSKVSKEELVKIAKIIAASHDFGKSTDFFQKYLNNRIKKSDMTNHSELSAFFSRYLAEKINICKKYLPFIITKSHHGKISTNFTTENDIYKEQLESINFDELKILYNELLNINVDFDEFKSLIFDEESDLYSDLREELLNLPEQNSSLQDFFLALFLFSLLIDSDKLDAGVGYEESLDIKDKIANFNLPDAVDKHKFTIKNDNPKINSIREEIYREVDNAVDNINLNEKIYSINVPTGTGKTFTSLNFALKLKNRLIKEQGFNPKIIYCLPFTSIIDQNYDVIEKILKSNDEEITNDKLLKHHHLAEVSYKMQKDEEHPDEFESLETGKSLLLTESWLSSIIVTTFVQFFHSLISNSNRSLKKFHNVANSIVILDEIQAVPYKYWILIKETLKTFSEMFNTYFILVTATQPLIFEPKEIKSLVDAEKYFHCEDLNRIKLRVNLEPQSLEQFGEMLAEDIEQNPDKSFLIILNTIKSSQEVYNNLVEELKSDEKTELLYLSTTILPVERLGIIDKVKKKEKRIILVSTQVVEAGVDIDLDVVYRDLAPLDCIFQSAGRCNRNAGDLQGIVKIIQLINENHKDKPFSEYVYSLTLLKQTIDVLKEKNEYEERDFYKLSKSYFSLIDPNLEANIRIISNDESNKILDRIKQLDFPAAREFKLIEDDSNACDFFIELNNEARQIKDKVKEIYETQTGFERKNKFLELKKEFYKYVVSVRLKKGQEHNFSPEKFQVFKGNPILIPHEEVNDFYDMTGIGFNFLNSEKLDSEGLII